MIWSCHHRAIKCPNGHLYELKVKGMQRDHQSLQGHEFFRCDRCTPSTYWFVVFSTTPDRHASCYEISLDCWREWQSNPADTTLPTTEMLHMLRSPDGTSYNPQWIPT